MITIVQMVQKRVFFINNPPQKLKNTNTTSPLIIFYSRCPCFVQWPQHGKSNLWISTYGEQLITVQCRMPMHPHFYSYATESIGRFIEDQAFSRSYELAPPPPRPPLPSASCLSFSVFLCVSGCAYWRERGRGWGRSQIIRPQESPVFYKSFNTLRVIVYRGKIRVKITQPPLSCVYAAWGKPVDIYLIIHTLFLYKYHTNIGSTFNVKK